MKLTHANIPVSEEVYDLLRESETLTCAADYDSGWECHCGQTCAYMVWFILPDMYGRL